MNRIRTMALGLLVASFPSFALTAYQSRIASTEMSNHFASVESNISSSADGTIRPSDDFVSALVSDAVKEVQRALNNAGFDAGPVDGVWGAKTVEALRRFQTNSSLDATGRLDCATVAKLGLTAQANSSGASTSGTAASRRR